MVLPGTRTSVAERSTISPHELVDFAVAACDKSLRVAPASFRVDVATKSFRTVIVAVSPHCYYQHKLELEKGAGKEGESVTPSIVTYDDFVYLFDVSYDWRTRILSSGNFLLAPGWSLSTG